VTRQSDSPTQVPFSATVIAALRGVPANALPTAHRFALVAIASFANPDGSNSHPSVQTISDVIGKSRSQTVQILKQLIDAGWLQRGARLRQFGGGQSSSEYRVMLSGRMVERKRRGGWE
jgi:hypothetical protein